jgi:hypothetical protein
VVVCFAYVAVAYVVRWVSLLNDRVVGDVLTLRCSWIGRRRRSRGRRRQGGMKGGVMSQSSTRAKWVDELNVESLLCTMIVGDFDARKNDGETKQLNIIMTKIKCITSRFVGSIKG